MKFVCFLYIPQNMYTWAPNKGHRYIKKINVSGHHFADRQSYGIPPFGGFSSSRFHVSSCLLHWNIRELCFFLRIPDTSMTENIIMSSHAFYFGYIVVSREGKERGFNSHFLAHKIKTNIPKFFHIDIVIILDIR